MRVLKDIQDRASSRAQHYEDLAARSMARLTKARDEGYPRMADTYFDDVEEYTTKAMAQRAIAEGDWLRAAWHGRGSGVALKVLAVVLTVSFLVYFGTVISRVSARTQCVCPAEEEQHGR